LPTLWQYRRQSAAKPLACIHKKNKDDECAAKDHDATPASALKVDENTKPEFRLSGAEGEF